MREQGSDRNEAEAKQEERKSHMEFYHQYVSGGGGGYSSAKEKRPPLKRGQLKRQI